MIGETVVRLRAPFKAERDRYGNRERDWAAATETEFAGCAVAPRYFTGSVREETSQGRQGVIIGLTVYLPAGADMRATDRLRVRGDDFEVDGEPGDWRSPYQGTERGVEVALRRVTG